MHKIVCLLQEERLIRRGAETVDEIQLRLRNAEIELEEAYRCQLFDHIMVNNVFDQSVNQIFRLARDWYSRCCPWFNPTIIILALLLAPLWLGTLPFPPRRDCVCWWDALKTWSPWFVRWEKIPLRFPLWRLFSCIYLAEWFFIALGFKVVTYILEFVFSIDANKMGGRLNVSQLTTNSFFIII